MSAQTISTQEDNEIDQEQTDDQWGGDEVGDDNDDSSACDPGASGEESKRMCVSLNKLRTLTDAVHKVKKTIADAPTSECARTCDSIQECKPRATANLI
jgi:hypothetical protein